MSCHNMTVMPDRGPRGGVTGYLEAALQQLSAGDDVGDLRLVQPVGDGVGSQGGVQSDDWHRHTDTHKYSSSIVI